MYNVYEHRVTSWIMFPWPCVENSCELILKFLNRSTVLFKSIFGDAIVIIVNDYLLFGYVLMCFYFHLLKFLSAFL